MYGMSLGHHVIVTASPLIGSGDGVVVLMALDIKAHAHKGTVCCKMTCNLSTNLNDGNHYDGNSSCIDVRILLMD